MKMTTAFLKPRRSVAAAILLSLALSTVARGQVIPFLDDFEDGDATDGIPVSWLLGTGDTAELEVVNGDYVITPDNLVNVMSSYVVETSFGPDITGDVSVRTELRYLDVVESAGIFARGSADGESFHAGIALGSQVFVGTTGGEFLITDTNLTPFEPVVIQLDVEEAGASSFVAVIAWQADDPMPDDPLLSFTAPSRIGSVGVFIDAHDTELGSVAFREFSAALDPGAHLSLPTGVLQAGDADMDLDFDQLDLVKVQVAGKYLTGQAATWGEGDWNGAPGGEPGNPPPGNGFFDQRDIIAAVGPGHYLTGPYAAISPRGSIGDEQTTIVYNAVTGELSVDAPTSTELTSINIDSAAAIFTGDAAMNLGGSFDNDADNNIFKATFGSSFGSLSLGNVAQTGLSEDFVLNDLTVVGSLAGGGDLGPVDLIYVPEPTSLVLLLLTAFALLARRRVPSV